MGWDDDDATNNMDVSLTTEQLRVTCSIRIQLCITWRVSADRTGSERKYVAEWSWMFEGDGAFPRQPVHGGKDLGPGITGQQGGEFIQRAVADPSELLVDCRFDQKFLCHIVLPPTPRNE